MELRIGSTAFLYGALLLLLLLNAHSVACLASSSAGEDSALLFQEAAAEDEVSGNSIFSLLWSLILWFISLFFGPPPATTLTQAPAVPTTSLVPISPSPITMSPTEDPLKAQPLPTETPSESPTGQQLLLLPSESPSEKLLLPSESPSDATIAYSSIPSFSPGIGTFAPVDTTPSPATEPPTLSPPEETTYYCTCPTCTDDVWNRVAAGFSCGDRITFLLTDQNHLYPSQTDACSRVADIEYPQICGACDPNRCDGRTPPPPDRTSFCGCDGTCTLQEWTYQSHSEDLSCEAHATWLLLHGHATVEAEACRQANCQAACHPDYCGTGGTPPLYCFPPPQDRVTFENVWDGGYTVQIKESPGLCGPGDNRFSRDAVSLDSDSQQLTLSFEYINGVGWVGSEVRVVLPNDEAFTYGTYEFSVESVSVLDNNDVLVSEELPISLVLGLFTWDDTDNYAEHENWNHEVDIEISMWGNAANTHDAQFLVQPPGDPQMYRFSTGLTDGQRDQGGHVYSFTWNPGTVDWLTDAGGEQDHSYSTEQALGLGLEDFVQCLPAQMEVRMNLWNIYGTGTPTGMETNQRVEVVISSFSYLASGETVVVPGGSCSKDCQCEWGCVGNLCASE